MKRVPKPKAQELKILAATRADRLNTSAPAPDHGLPEPPSHLDTDGKLAWECLVKQLSAMRVLTPADGHALAIYCSAYSRRLRAEESLRESGEVVLSDTGAMKANPSAAIVAKCESTMLRVLTEFGLTPSSRSRVSVPAEGPKDRLSEFLSRRKSTS